MKTSDIKKVIDAGLADIETTQRDVDAIMEYIRNAETRKPARKMPLAVAIAMVLMLIGAVAFAAMSFLGVIEHLYSIEEKEQEAAISEWSFEHKMEVVDLLVGNGIIFNEEMLMQVYDDELSETEKSSLIDQMLMERFPEDYWSVTALGILVHEKGYPHQWTHEERVWYESLIDSPMEEVGNWRYILPTENDLPEEEALEITYQYFYDNYGLNRDCFDPEQQYACFEESIAEDNILIRSWTVKLSLIGNEYNGQELMLQDVQLSIRNDGSIYAVCGPNVRTWEDDWFDTSNAADFWTIEGLYAFQIEWKPKIEQMIADGESVTKDLKYLITKNFGLPDDNDISIENARSIAKDTILAQEDWTEEMLLHYTYREAYFTGGTNQYCILYTLADVPASKLRDDLYDMNYNGEIPYSIRICIDARTGEILEVYQLERRSSLIDAIGI